jgi:hypothetical protein
MASNAALRALRLTPLVGNETDISGSGEAASGMEAKRASLRPIMLAPCVGREAGISG